MKIIHNYELKEMGEPIKETDCWLFFEKGKVAKHTIESFHQKNEIEQFRKYLRFKEYLGAVDEESINNLIN